MSQTEIYLRNIITRKISERIFDNGLLARVPGAGSFFLGNLKEIFVPGSALGGWDVIAAIQKKDNKKPTETVG